MLRGEGGRTEANYDVVTIGGGPNGLGITAYLAKCGLRVCLCDARFEVGGAVECIEAIPGFGIHPHAPIDYAAAKSHDAIPATALQSEVTIALASASLVHYAISRRWEGELDCVVVTNGIA